MTDGFVRVADTGPLSSRTLTPDQKERVEHVLDLAAAWKRKEISFFDVAGQTTGRDRFLARACTDRSDPRVHALQALFGRLIRQQGFEVTNQGVFPRSVLGELNVTLITTPLKHEPF